MSNRIPHTYRAAFRQPVLRADQIQVKITTPIHVELYQIGRGWKARAMQNGAIYDTGTKALQTQKTAVEALFVEKLTDWYPCDKRGRQIPPPTPSGHVYPSDAAEQ